MKLSLKPAPHSLVYRRLVLPFLALLRMGATPRRLAWSISLGLVIGINPLLGSTTLLCLGLAALFRLNLAASQLANHLMYPVEIVLVIPFLRLGARVFRTGPIPLAPETLFAAVRAHPGRVVAGPLAVGVACARGLVGHDCSPASCNRVRAHTGAAPSSAAHSAS